MDVFFILAQKRELPRGSFWFNANLVGWAKRSVSTDQLPISAGIALMSFAQPKNWIAALRSMATKRRGSNGTGRKLPCWFVHRVHARDAAKSIARKLVQQNHQRKGAKCIVCPAIKFALRSRFVFRLVVFHSRSTGPSLYQLSSTSRWAKRAFSFALVRADTLDPMARPGSSCSGRPSQIVRQAPEMQPAAIKLGLNMPINQVDV